MKRFWTSKLSTRREQDVEAPTGVEKIEAASESRKTMCRTNDDIYFNHGFTCAKVNGEERPEWIFGWRFYPMTLCSQINLNDIK